MFDRIAQAVASVLRTLLQYRIGVVTNMVFLAVCGFIAFLFAAWLGGSYIAFGAIFASLIATLLAILRVVEKTPGLAVIPELRHLSTADRIRAVNELLTSQNPAEAIGSSKLETDPTKSLPPPLPQTDEPETGSMQQ